jgi:hypothetical protein
MILHNDLVVTANKRKADRIGKHTFDVRRVRRGDKHKRDLGKSTPRARPDRILALGEVNRKVKLR